VRSFLTRNATGRGFLRILLWIWVVVSILGAFRFHTRRFVYAHGQSASLPAELSIWADPEGSATIEQVSDPFWADRFTLIERPFAQPVPPEAPVHWYRMRIENREGERRSIVLELGNRDLGEAVLFTETQVPGTFLQQSAGMRGGPGRLLAPDTATFFIELEERSSIFAFLRIRDLNGVPRGLGGVVLWESREEFEGGQRALVAWTGFVLGILLVALTYHVAVLFALRLRDTLPYILHLAAFGMLQALLLAPPLPFLMELPSGLWNGLEEFAFGATVASLVWFTFVFLEVRRSRLVSRLLLVLITIWLLMLPLAVLARAVGDGGGRLSEMAGIISQGYLAVLITTPAILFLAALLRLRLRSAWAGTYLAVFSAFLASLMIAGEERLGEGLISRNTLVLLQAAGALHMVGVSGVLGLRLYRQRMKADRQARTYTERLERSVEQRTQELRRTSDNLAASNAQKDRLFSIIAHDLRGPLNSIVAASGRISSRPDQFTHEEVVGYAADIHGQAQSLRETLENLLNWARVQTNRMELQNREFPVEGLVQDIARFLASELRERGLMLELAIEPDLRAFWDYEAIKAILRNFLTNAMKVSRRGSRVVLRARSVDGRVEFEVEDFGRGMTPDERARLFQIRDKQERPATEEPGAGIGLVLCAELATRLEARIEVETESGKGSLFRLVLGDGPRPPVVRGRG
jgi:signal transduction histidine kinase